MPPRPPRPQRRVPLRLVWFHRFPQSKVARRILLVLVHIDARAVFDAIEVLLRQLPVVGVLRNAEVPAPILGLIREVLRRQPLDQRHHLRDVFGGARQVLRPLDCQRVHILEERLLEARGVLADRLARRERVADNLVFHVGHVHHVLDRDALLAEKSPQHVDMQEGAEVADVTVVVNRRPARIHAQRRRAHRLQPLQLPAHCVEEFQRRHSTHRRNQRVSAVQSTLSTEIAHLRFYRRLNQTKPRILTDEHGLRAGSLSLIRVYPCDPWSGLSSHPSFKPGTATRSSPANSPATNLPQAAAAIIAALSVDIANAGNDTGSPRRSASAVKRSRSSLFAATPPETMIPRAPYASAAANVCFSRLPTTA